MILSSYRNHSKKKLDRYQHWIRAAGVACVFGHSFSNRSSERETNADLDTRLVDMTQNHRDVWEALLNIAKKKPASPQDSLLARPIWRDFWRL